MGYTLRTENYRYVEWRDFSTGEITAEELYKHSASELDNVPSLVESQNIADTVQPELLTELSNLLQATHPPKRLSLIPAVHTNPSGSARLPLRCTLRNEYGSNITVYNIKPSGARAKGHELEPGESIAYNARIGGVFVIESNDGKLHEIHSPSWPETTINIGKRSPTPE